MFCICCLANATLIVQKAPTLTLTCFRPHLIITLSLPFALFLLFTIALTLAFLNFVRGPYPDPFVLPFILSLAALGHSWAPADLRQRRWKLIAAGCRRLRGCRQKAGSRLRGCMSLVLTESRVLAELRALAAPRDLTPTPPPPSYYRPQRPPKCFLSWRQGFASSFPYLGKIYVQFLSTLMVPPPQ